MIFSTLVLIFIYAFWISLIGGTLTLFGFRLYFVLNKRFEIKKTLYILLMPCSIGFYQHITDKNALTKIYRVLVVLFFIAMFLASIFVLYMHLNLDLI